jgi:hypothetical protein
MVTYCELESTYAMKRSNLLLVSFLGLLIVGIFWHQFGLYRTPLHIEQTEELLIIRATPHKDDIPAIDEPQYETVTAADLYLNDAGYGLFVEVGSLTRFYPFQILVWHQVVNDVLNGRSLLITFSPLTYSPAVYETSQSFGVSGKVWNSNGLLYDYESQSLWSQMLGLAIEGERTGATLDRYPAQVMTWNTFKTDYSNGQVLSRKTGYDRDYTQDPYEGYEDSNELWFALSHEDGRLMAKSLVYGLQTDEMIMAFPVDSIEEFDTIQEIVGSESLQLAYWFAWAAMHPNTKIYSQ